MKSILVVDDDAEDLEFIEEALNGEGYRVICLRNGQEAFQRAQKEKPDLMILDVLMPKLDGAELVYRLRHQPGTSDIPFIFLTSAAEGLNNRFVAGKVTYEVFGKPFKKEELLCSIRRILSPAEK